MIFVTVGTHEQPFDRLVEYIDRLKENGNIADEVVIQTGYSTYEPRHCRWQKLFPYQQMLEFVDEARIVITHGGPSSFIMPLQVGKIPVVVPRQKQYGEHVNDHQLEFGRAVAERQKNIILVEEMAALGDVIANYDDLAGQMDASQNSNNLKFCAEFTKLAEELVR